MKALSILILLLGSVSFAGDLPKDSLYQIRSQWQDQNDQALNLSQLMGQPVVVSMVYLSCPHTCPLTVAKLQAVEKKIKAKGVHDYRIVLASFDVEHDKPEQMKAYMKKKGLDETHWTFLSGKTDEQVRELAIVLGINYKKLDDGDFSHSNVIALLDKQGRVVSKLDRLSADESPLVASLGK